MRLAADKVLDTRSIFSIIVIIIYKMREPE